MELMHRFGDTSRENYVDDYIKIIKDNKGSGDVVWLSTCYGYPSLEKHKEHAEKQKDNCYSTPENSYWGETL